MIRRHLFHRFARVYVNETGAFGTVNRVVWQGWHLPPMYAVQLDCGDLIGFREHELEPAGPRAAPRIRLVAVDGESGMSKQATGEA